MIVHNRLFLLLIPFFLVPLTQKDLSGQTIPSPYRFIESRQDVGLFLEYMNIGTGRFGYGPAPGPVMGGRYGVNLSGPLAIEARINYMPTTRDLIDPSRVEGDRYVGEVESEIASFDARFRFSLPGHRTWHGWSPFLTAGGGMAFDIAAADPLETERLLPDDQFQFGNTFVGLLGGGTRWFPTDRIIVRGDISLTIWQLKAPRGFSDPDNGIEKVDRKEWASGPSFSFGVGFRF